MIVVVYFILENFSFGYGQGSLHPAVVKVGLQYASGIICGSNARCIAMVAAFKKVSENIIVTRSDKTSLITIKVLLSLLSLITLFLNTIF